MKPTLPLLCIILLFCYSVSAQVYTVSPTTTITPVKTITPYGIISQSDVFTTRMNTVFQYVDRTPVTTGPLNDYGMNITNVGKFVNYYKNFAK